MKIGPLEESYLGEAGNCWVNAVQERVQAFADDLRAFGNLKGLQADDQPGERPDNANASQDARQMLEELRPQRTMDQNLFTEVCLCRYGLANSGDLIRAAGVQVLLLVESVPKFLPEMAQNLVALEQLGELVKVLAVGLFEPFLESSELPALIQRRDKKQRQEENKDERKDAADDGGMDRYFGERQHGTPGA